MNRESGSKGRNRDKDSGAGGKGRDVTDHGYSSPIAITVAR